MPDHLYTILNKDDLYSLLSLISGSMPAPDGQLTRINAVAKLDPREEQPLVKPFGTRDEALTQYKAAIATSLDRGWRVAWQGQPMEG
ncbi:MAG: hypothetical protein ACKV2V_14070 [Blastocatellia bacterium]